MLRRTIGVLHPGEMGVAVALTAVNSGHEVLWASEGRSPQTERRAKAAGLLDAGSLAALCDRCDTIVSVCPPEFAEETARSVAHSGFRGLYIDANAISPRRVSRIGEMTQAAGSRFVDGSIIGLPARERGKTWIYLSGVHAAEANECFGGGPLEVEVLAGDIGRASALKMVFAGHTKAIAALRAAVLGAADGLGVLHDLERQWERSGTPMARAVESVEHVAPKAWRFVAEMGEIAETFESAGVPGGFHRAAAEIFERLAPFKGERQFDLEDALDRVTGRVSK